MHYDIVLAGFRLNAAEPPSKVLERVLGVTPEQARSLTQRFPTLLLKRADQATAQAVVQQLRQAGAQVEVTASDDASDAITPVRSPSSQELAPVAPAAAPRPAAATIMGAGNFAMPPSAAAASAMPSASTGVMPPRAPSSPGLPPLPPPPPRAPSQTGLAPVAPAVPQAVSLSAQREAPANTNALDAGDTGGSSYQLGDILAPVSAQPKKAPTAAAAPIAVSAGEDFDAPDMGGGLELDMSGGAAKASHGVAKGAAESPAFGGMQSFGDSGLDGFESESPALELDTGADWRKQPQTSTAPARAAAPRMSSPQVDVPNRESMVGAAARPAPQRITPLERSLTTRITDAAQDLFEWTVAMVAKLLALAVVTAMSAAAVGYARSPEAVYELVGIESYPEQLPKIAPGASVAATTDALIALPVRTHPVLRMVPDALRDATAEWLRSLVPGVYPAGVAQPKTAPGARCLLVDTRPDPSDREVRERLVMLLRTGHALKPDLALEQELAREASALTRKLGAKSHVTPLCLAP